MVSRIYKLGTLGRRLSHSNVCVQPRSPEFKSLGSEEPPPKDLVICKCSTEWGQKTKGDGRETDLSPKPNGRTAYLNQ